MPHITDPARIASTVAKPMTHATGVMGVVKLGLTALAHYLRILSTSSNRSKHGSGIGLGIFLFAIGWATPALLTESAAQASGLKTVHRAPISLDSLKRDTPAPPYDYRLPAILSARDRALYRHIFESQKAGAWTAADISIGLLDNRILMGHVLRQRLMHETNYRSDYQELSSWLKSYRDHPHAQGVYHLAQRRRPKGWRAPLPPLSPQIAPVLRGQEVETPDSPPDPGRTRSARRDQWRIRSWSRSGYVTRALQYLDSKGPSNRLTPTLKAESLSIIARGYYHYQKLEKSIEAAERALNYSPEGAKIGLWWGGVAAFRLERYLTAHKYFSILARSPVASEDLRSAAAFWAARASMRAPDPAGVNTYLHLAASYPREFYGLLALRALGYPAPVDWTMPTDRSRFFDQVLASPAVQRAIALIEVGELARGESELLRLGDLFGPAANHDLLIIGDWLNLPSVVQDAAESLFRGKEPLLRASLYPVPGFRPTDGFRIDRALIFSMMHIESRFRLSARSRVGAAGLMQLMPATASYISGIRYRGAKRQELYDPSINIELGQAYIEYLMRSEPIGSNLIYVAAGYNGGPGNLRKWRKRLALIDDPLLFMESLPVRETAGYVEEVLGNLWIYRMRLGQPSPSMDAILRGEWPTYVPMDPIQKSVAQVTNR